jgi:hypothetical protein
LLLSETRHAVRWLPRVRIYERPRPAHEPFSWDIMTDVLKEQTRGNQNGARSIGIIWNRIQGDDVIDFDGMPGMPSKLRPAAATLDYKNEWRNTDKYSFRHVPTEEEKALRALDVDILEAQLAELNAKDNPDDTDKERIAAAEAILAQLRDGGTSYKRTAYNAMDSGVSGLFWGLAAPNVPVTLTGNFLLDKNRAQSIRLKRLAPHEEQVNHEFVIEIGNSSTSTEVAGQLPKKKRPEKEGKTLYAIAIGGDGNSAEFIHYRNMTTAEREELVEALNEVLNRGRLSVEDRKQILEWETAIQAIEAARNGKKLTASQSAEKERLKKQIKDLKDSRKLTKADEEERDEIERQLYIAKEPFKLQESAIDLVGKPVDFVLHYLLAGFVPVHSEDSRYIYENKLITKLARYATMLPANSYITLKSNGGKFGFVHGHPKHNSKGSIWSQPFTIPFLFEDDEVTWNYEGDASKPGCSIDFELLTLEEPRTVGSGASAVFIPGRYQVRIDLRSDVDVPKEEVGHYTPELYRAELHIKGGAIPAFGVEVWNSQIHGARSATNSGNCIKDVLIQDDRTRSLSCQVVVDNSGDGAGLPFNLGALACDVEFYDRDNDETIVQQRLGKIVETPVTAVEDVDTEEGFAMLTGAGSEISFHVVGPENWLDIPIKAPIVGNNKFPNLYWRELAHDAGLPAEVFANVAAATDGFRKIERPQPGKFPDCKPGYGAHYLEFMRDALVKKHMPGKEQWSDDEGIRIAAHSFRNRPELAFDVPPNVPVTSRLCLRGRSDGSSRPVFKQDLRDYYTGATFIGAINPATGMRYHATETIPQATDEAFKDSMFYVGEPRTYTAEVDDSLKSDAACLKAAREFLNITPLTPDGLPPYYAENVEIDLEPTLRAGDIPRIFGIKVLVDANEFSSLNAGDGQRSRIGLRLAEDVRPLEVEL